MKIWIAIAALGLLTGCMAMTPNDLINERPPVDVALRLKPVDAAACLARAAENYQTGYVGRIRNIDTDKTELIISNEAAINVAVVHLAPSPTGSTARMWLWNHAFHKGVVELLKSPPPGC